MPRLRALLAILLAVTWCSAAWHVELEVVELMFVHQHHTHDHSNGDHAPQGGTPDGHDEVFARHTVKDQVRIGSGPTLWFTLPGIAVWLASAFVPRRTGSITPRQRSETGPPLVRVWQFVQRCAPQSAAPPALR